MGHGTRSMEHGVASWKLGPTEMLPLAPTATTHQVHLQRGMGLC
jgi:hypothetical protein